MTKYIAREVPPEQRDFSFYFDGDGFTGTKENPEYMLYIPGDRNSYGLHYDEYKEVLKQAEAILEGFSDVEEGTQHPFENKPLTYKFIMEDYGIPYNATKCHALKEWCKRCDAYLKHRYEINTDLVAEFLTITTGMEWNSRSFRGYCQGDWCDVVYCTKGYSEETINEVGHIWLGCASEFGIGEEDYMCYGFYVIDDIRWTEDERLVKALADMYGCKPEELTVELVDKVVTVRVPKYKTLTVKE